ncbi:MAG: DNA repair protein RadA [Phycisphaerales bacterium]
MAKVKQVFACNACGSVQSKWMGKCPDCGAWDSLEMERIEPKARVDPRGAAMETWNEGGGGAAGPDGGNAPKARPITEIGGEAIPGRIATGIAEFDRVLGGGLVPGSAVLVGGDPGIGKSTLLLQAAGSLAERGVRTLYVSSEESADQVRLRAARLGIGGHEQLFLLADTSLGRITEQAARVLGELPEGQKPVLIIDSIQMIYKADLEAFPGSLTQLRRCCAELVYFAKASGTTVMLVGHVTKDGQLAGPRLLEHLVDAVLYFEGDRYHAHRVVRAVKNRYGTTLELGLFEMTGGGLKQAPDGVSVLSLSGDARPRPGTVVCPVLTGTRCLLVELQALTATGFLGTAKRKASGIDTNRLAMLIAVLEQHAGLRLADRDIFASSAGGVKIAEPAADLALLLAIAGAHYRKSIGQRVAVVGEVGLGGEVRPVSQLESRVHEAKRLGCTAVVTPRGTGVSVKGVEIVQVRSVQEAMEQLE